MDTKVYVIYRLEAFEPDEVIAVIMGHELEEAKSYYAAMQDNMSIHCCIVIRPMVTGLAGYFTDQEMPFWGNKRD
jgi:hypothetical protein